MTGLIAVTLSLRMSFLTLLWGVNATPTRHQDAGAHERNVYMPCADDMRYRSPQGLPCAAYSFLDCHHLGLVGFSIRATEDLLSHCRDSCSVHECETQLNRRHPSQDQSAHMRAIAGVPHKSIHTASIRSLRRKLADSPENTCQNVDNPLYRSPQQGGNCSSYSGFDCFMFLMIGFSQIELYHLLNNCPKACNVPCGTFTLSPSSSPSSAPSVSNVPTPEASGNPTAIPSDQPSSPPSHLPSSFPTSKPSLGPSSAPSSEPSQSPSALHSQPPSESVMPSAAPSSDPSSDPSSMPSGSPSSIPSVMPSVRRSTQPTLMPSAAPSSDPSSDLSSMPSGSPSSIPSVVPSVRRSMQPTLMPSGSPSVAPSMQLRWVPEGIVENPPGTVGRAPLLDHGVLAGCVLGVVIVIGMAFFVYRVSVSRLESPKNELCDVAVQPYTAERNRPRQLDNQTLDSSEASEMSEASPSLDPTDASQSLDPTQTSVADTYRIGQLVQRWEHFHYFNPSNK